MAKGGGAGSRDILPNPRLAETEIYGMRSQITRAAVSVPADVAEGWTRESRKEKAQFFAIAHGALS
jgi:four helix bundle protein